MQESLVISAPLTAGTIQTDINAVLAQATPNWTPWKITNTFTSGNMVFIVFVREPAPAPASNSSPYVVPPSH